MRPAARGVPPSDASATRVSPRLLGDAVFLHERLLRMVEHERVVGRERDIEPDREELVEGVLRQTEEERVVRQRRERQPDLRDVVEVLEARRLLEVDAVVDPPRAEEGGVQVVQLAGLASVRTKAERREALRRAPRGERGSGAAGAREGASPARRAAG